MFDRLIISSPRRPEMRLPRFIAAASMFYVTALVAAIVASILGWRPELVAPRDSPPPIPWISPARAPAESDGSGGGRRQSPTFNPKGEVLDLSDVTGRPYTGPSLPWFDSKELVEGGDGSGSKEGCLGGRFGDGKDPSSGAAPPRPRAEVEATKAERERSPLRVSSNVIQGKAIERPVPAYPKIAQQIGLEGSVEVELVVSEDGRVEAARAVSGHPVLKRPAEEAAWGWRFQPTILNGQAVKVTAVITFMFRLSSGGGE